MCGITGSLSRNPQRIEGATTRLAHRGPDAASTFRRDLPDGRSLTLGHRRLSIVDLSQAANQPLASHCGRYRMVFNGEIYNWRALRAELSQHNITFTTSSDSEVLLASFGHWGDSAFARLDGMFAVAIWDEQDRELILARDPFGIKPLYFSHDSRGGMFHFASEIDALLDLSEQEGVPDRGNFAEFLLNGFLYEPNTGLSNVRKLAPGQAARLSVAGDTLSMWQYAESDKQDGTRDRPLSELLETSVGLQALADVRVGLFFSGGLDSSVLAAAYPGTLSGLMMDYSDDPSDVGIDQRYARKIADFLDFPLVIDTVSDDISSPERILADFRSVAAGIDEPISDFTYFATRQLSRRAREHGFKVMLSGMGGDELFGGYPRFKIARLWGPVRAGGAAGRAVLSLLSRHPRMAKRAERLRGFAQSETFGEAYTRLIGYLSFEQVAGLLGEPIRDRYLADMEHRLRPVASETPLKQAMFLDRQGFLAHNLTVTDRASMAESIEVRVPLITPALADWAMAQRDGDLLNLSGTKRPLHDYARSRLPRSLVDRPKQGFNPPLDHRIEMLGKDCIVSTMAETGLFDQVERAEVMKIVHSHFSRTTNQTYCLWHLLYFGMWLDHRKKTRTANPIKIDQQYFVHLE